MSLYMLHTDIAADLIHGKAPALDSRIAATAPQLRRRSCAYPQLRVVNCCADYPSSG